jgi:hypothetical protein
LRILALDDLAKQKQRDQNGEEKVDMVDNRVDQNHKVPLLAILPGHPGKPKVIDRSTIRR